ncbi:MAG: extracellular solute-binding protein, partial [Bacteroidetes bacterium]|nr:extracellular solute-binding protein [Bacteroidota bacterium]
KEVLARSLRGEDDAIDIFAVDIIGVHRFAKWSEPLEQYFSDEELRCILPVAMKTCYYNGNLMAMPFVLVQGVMYYREDLLSNSKEGRELLKKVQNGITWEEFVTARHTMEMKNPFYIFQASDYEGFICSYIENLLSLNPNYFETKGFNFTTRESRQALQYLVDLVQTEKLSPPIVTSFTEFNSFQYFIQNDGLFVRGWTTYDKDFESEPVDLKKQQCLRKALTPHPAQGRPATVLGGWNLMISKSSKKKDAAVAFMKFLLQNESQEILYKYAGYHPIVQEFYTNPMYEERYPEIKEMRTFMRYGVLRPVQENYTRYSKIMARYFSLAVAGKMSVDDALREAQHAIDLEERQKNGKGMAK